MGKKSKIGIHWHLFTRITHRIVGFFSLDMSMSSLVWEADGRSLRLLIFNTFDDSLWTSFLSELIDVNSSFDEIPNSYDWCNQYDWYIFLEHQDDRICLWLVNLIVSIWEDRTYSIRNDMFMFNWNVIAHRAVMSSLTVRSSVLFDWWSFCLVYFWTHDIRCYCNLLYIRII